MKTKTKDRLQKGLQSVKTFWTKHRPLVNQSRKNLLSVDMTQILVRRGRKAVRSIDAGSREAIILQYRLLDEILKENKDTEYGKKYGFAGIHGVQEFKEKVPLTEYDDYEPLVRRMMEGEQNVLSAHPPKYYAMTTGRIPGRMPHIRSAMK